jgi:endonuclease/exonuclease/phosphatase (EEP) superfamily protein YafD
MRQLAAIGDRARSDPPALVMGDLNATPWSRPFAELRAHGGLCDSRAGFGVQPSFPSASAALRIPIDHLLASCSIGVRDRRIGPDVGSDHLPVILDLVVPRP